MYIDYMEESRKLPKYKAALSSPENIAERLQLLVGQKFIITGKTRTDGSNFRKVITKHLLSGYMPEASNDYEIVPPKHKGVPVFLREYIDTYIVTADTAYNLQVWNRNPNSMSV